MLASLFPWIPDLWSHLFTQQGNKNRSGDYPLRDVQRSSLVSRESPGFLEGVKPSHIQSKTPSPLLLSFQEPPNRGKNNRATPGKGKGLQPVSPESLHAMSSLGLSTQSPGFTLSSWVSALYSPFLLPPPRNLLRPTSPSSWSCGAGRQQRPRRSRHM